MISNAAKMLRFGLFDGVAGATGGMNVLLVEIVGEDSDDCVISVGIDTLGPEGSVCLNTGEDGL
jgi:hypothetical protein